MSTTSTSNPEPRGIRQTIGNYIQTHSTTHQAPQAHGAIRPSGLDLTGQVEVVSKNPVAIGGSADVYLGEWVDTSRKGEKLAVKFLRFAHLEEKKVKTAKKLAKETKAWVKLIHPNIHLFYGTSLGLRPASESPAMISPWMANGNMTEYIANHPDADKYKLICQITSGLVYLHGEHIVHGDLKGNNVLINDAGDAIITDFGRSKIMDDTDYTTSLMFATAWTAPEIFLSENEVSVSYKSDIWALGMTALELYVGFRTLWGGARPAKIILMVTKGTKPEPEAYPSFPSGYWKAFEGCWAFEGNDRPEAKDVYTRLESITL
ncbi:kinase-like protein [Rickenella mellea]|uniref:Kinase-like protein n=1 Tax=Rickenella mellea TaxID=50990 RepID=A0A4Y7Q6W5_9AGAM|nr:kinase-like protein [Rickenella mellea]